MMKNFTPKNFGILGVFFLIIATGVLLFLKDGISKKEIHIGEEYFQVEIADSVSEQVKGLSERRPLEQNEGLLFVFEQEDIHGFWMKDMLFSIDIVWINAQFEVIEISRNASPESYPEIFYPPAPVKYVLEVLSGEAEEISFGDKLFFTK